MTQMRMASFEPQSSPHRPSFLLNSVAPSVKSGTSGIKAAHFHCFLYCLISASSSTCFAVDTWLVYSALEHIHRITECSGLEGTSVGHLVQPPCRSRVTYSRLHRTLSRRVLNISREGDSTTSLGSTVPVLPLVYFHFLQRN